MILVSEMTYTVSSGTLNSSVPYHTNNDTKMNCTKINLSFVQAVINLCTVLCTVAPANDHPGKKHCFFCFHLTTSP